MIRFKFLADFFVFFFHDVGARFLLVEFAAIAEERELGELLRIRRNVVPVPQLLHVPLRQLIAAESLISLHINEAGAGTRALPEVRVMRRQVPTPCPAHREAHEHRLPLDLVPLLDVLDRFEDIDFAGKFVGVAVPAERMEDDRVGELILAALLLTLGNEVHVGPLVTPPAAKRQGDTACSHRTSQEARFRMVAANCRSVSDRRELAGRVLSATRLCPL